MSKNGNMWADCIFFSLNCWKDYFIDSEIKFALIIKKTMFKVDIWQNVIFQYNKSNKNDIIWKINYNKISEQIWNRRILISKICKVLIHMISRTKKKRLLNVQKEIYMKRY